MPVVNYTGKNTQTFRGEDSKQFFKFLPGANEVPNEDWEWLQKNKSVKNFKAQDRLKVIVVPVPASKPAATGKLAKVGEAPPEKEKVLDTLADADISVMDAWSAIALVEGVIDMAHLARFKKQETKRKDSRKTVMSALEAQVSALKEMTPKGE